jgi:hypothetical protein
MVVAMTVHDLCKTNKVYGKRFWIEPMHKDWKTNAFYLENTRVTDPKRIVTLLIPIAFAYVYLRCCGQELNLLIRGSNCFLNDYCDKKC